MTPPSRKSLTHRVTVAQEIAHLRALIGDLKSYPSGEKRQPTLSDEVILEFMRRSLLQIFKVNRDHFNDGRETNHLDDGEILNRIQSLKIEDALPISNFHILHFEKNILEWLNMSISNASRSN